MSGSLLIVHGGAPTAVLNSSLYGCVTEAKSHGEFHRVLGALGGCGGVLREEFLDFSQVPDSQLSLLPVTPASAIGTSRDSLAEADYDAMALSLRRSGVRYAVFTGGNGTMDTCGKLYRACQRLGTPVQIMGVPKTIDNDIAVTDHAPGYGSAARYLAATVAEVSADVRALPIHVSVVEAMGRNAGWLAASSALAGPRGEGGPDLIYLPERPFVEEEFLEDVSRIWKLGRGVVVVASEGLRGPDGAPIVPPLFSVGRAVYYGEVGAHLANLVIQRLGIKARSEKPGICGRASMAHQSPLDRDEAVLAGREAVRALLEGDSGKMVGFRRPAGEAYRTELIRIPIEEVMLEERTLPDSFIDSGKNYVTPAFLDWCRPLLGGPLGEFAQLRRR